MDLKQALAYLDGSKGGRPPFDPVLMFKFRVTQTLNNLSVERTEYMINDRLSFMRFLSLSLPDRVPDSNNGLAVPFFDYTSHVSIGRKFRLIRKWKTTDAAASAGARLREGLLDKNQTASSVWADTTYRSKANEDCMEKQGFISESHRKKPRSARVSIMSSLIRSHRWDCSSEQSASSGPA